MHVEQVQERFAHIAFARFLGVEISELAPERAVLRLPFRTDNTNPNGILHGGVTASLLDLAAALAVWTTVDGTAVSLLRTVDFSIQYIAAAMHEDIMAEARVLRRGRDVFFLEATAWGAAEKLISKGLIIYRAPQYAAPMRLHASAPLWQPPPMQTPSPWRRDPGFVKRLQITMAHHEAGRIRLHMPYSEEFTDDAGQLHEGALASLLDTAGTYTAWSLVPTSGSRGSTIGMQLNYTGVSATAVVADAQIQQRSEEVFFSLVQIRTVATHELVATGNVSYRLLEPRIA